MNYYQNSIENSGIDELVNYIKSSLNDYEGTEIEELHNNLFNTDYYIIGRYQAEQWLVKHAGVFNAIGLVTEYETENFGEVSTDLSEAEKVLNMLVYILGEEILNGLDTFQEYRDGILTSEVIELLFEELNSL